MKPDPHRDSLREYTALEIHAEHAIYDYFKGSMTPEMIVCVENKLDKNLYCMFGSWLTNSDTINIAGGFDYDLEPDGSYDTMKFDEFMTKELDIQTLLGTVHK